MLLSSSRERLLDVSAKLYARLFQIIHQLLIILAVLGNVTIPLVFVVRLRIVQLMVSLIGVLIGGAILFSIESGHHTDGAKHILGVHVVHFITYAGQVHSSRGTEAIHESIYLLTMLMGIVDSLLEVIDSPCRTTRRVNNKDVCLTELIICSLHHPIAQIHRAIGASTTFTSDRTIHRHDIDKRSIHFVHPPTGGSLTVFCHLVLIDDTDSLAILYLHGVRLFLLLKIECYAAIQVLLPNSTRAVDVFRHNHPQLCCQKFEKSIHIFCEFYSTRKGR